MILAVDPGFSRTGWAVFELSGVLVDYGCIVLPDKNKNRLSRYLVEDYHKWIIWMMSRIDSIIKQYPIKIIMSEMISLGGKNAIAVRDMSIAMCIISGVSYFNSLPVIFATNAACKIAILNNKNASKLQVKEEINKRYNNIFNKYRNSKGKYHKDFEHIADAIAVYHALKDDDVLNLLKAKKKGH